MFTASIGPYLYSIAGLDPASWSIPGFLRQRARAKGNRRRDEGMITMHITPDPHAVRVLGQATGTVKTMCGQVSIEWHAPQGLHFKMHATIPHNCGRARIVLHVPEPFNPSDALCLNGYGIEGSTMLLLPQNIFSAEVASDRKTVDVVVGGGHSTLRLASCGKEADLGI